MLLVKLTKKLSETIKEERLRKDITGSQLAEKIGKTAAYISQIENHKLKQIDFNVLHNIFRNLIDESIFNEYMEKLVNDNYNGLSIDEMKKQEWIITFDYQYRNIPIPESLIEYICDEMQNSNITISQLTEQINKNEDLSDEDKEDLIADRLYLSFDDEQKIASTTIKLNIKEDSVKKVLNKKISSIGYIYMLSMVYNLFKLKGFSKTDATDKATDILKDHKFYTEFERSIIMKENKDNDCPTPVGDLVDLYEIEYAQLLEKLKKNIDRIKMLDIDYVVKKLKDLDEGFSVDNMLMFAIMGLPIKNFKNTTREQRKLFVTELKDLIKKYSDEEEAPVNPYEV